MNRKSPRKKGQKGRRVRQTRQRVSWLQTARHWNKRRSSLVQIAFVWAFLDASSHFYKRVFPSVGPSVAPSVMLSVALLWKMHEIENFMYRNEKSRISSKQLSSIFTTQGGYCRTQIRGYAPKFLRMHCWPLGLVPLGSVWMTYIQLTPALTFFQGT